MNGDVEPTVARNDVRLSSEVVSGVLASAERALDIPISPPRLSRRPTVSSIAREFDVP